VPKTYEQIHTKGEYKPPESATIASKGFGTVPKIWQWSPPAGESMGYAILPYTKT
jgi:hypothetical protein